MKIEIDESELRRIIHNIKEMIRLPENKAAQFLGKQSLITLDGYLGETNEVQ